MGAGGPRPYSNVLGTPDSSPVMPLQLILGLDKQSLGRQHGSHPLESVVSAAGPLLLAPVELEPATMKLRTSE